MSVRHVCDGCGSDLGKGPRIPFGTVVVRDYCGTCAVTVRKFLEARDALHTKLAAEWGKKLERLAAAWAKAHPGGRLPDA